MIEAAAKRGSTVLCPTHQFDMWFLFCPASPDFVDPPLHFLVLSLNLDPLLNDSFLELILSKYYDSQFYTLK